MITTPSRSTVPLGVASFGIGSQIVFAPSGIVTIKQAGGDFDNYLKDWIFDAENSKQIQWETSGGNLLVVSQEENGCTIEVIGRRHGIPWGVLPDGWMGSIVNYEYLDTQRTDLKPWETAI